MLLQKIKMAIYIKSTISKLEKPRNTLEIVIVCIWNILNFKRLVLIATEMKQNIFGSMPLPHGVHSCAIILVLGHYPYLTEYILVV